LIAAPTGTVFVGDTALFAVQAIAADGVTPLANQSITFTAAGGAAILGACGAASCTILTDASGTASIAIAPQAAGNVTLTATGAAGTKTGAFTAAVRVRSITALNPTQYVAAGAAVAWELRVALGDNSASTAGVPVSWSGASVRVFPATSTTDSQGTAQTQASISPLASGAQVTAVACAWVASCTNFVAIGVDASEWKLAIVSGGGQSISASGTLAPVVLRVTDAVSHPVAGAMVEIHQTLDAWEPPCPDRGRCPIAPVYRASMTSAISTADGLITIASVQLPGVAGVTNIAAATGSRGFLSLALEERP
jgi:hypothetical protein